MTSWKFPRFLPILALTAACGLLTACGGQSVQSDNSPVNSDVQSASIVSLVYGTSSIPVDLTTFPTQDYKGTAVVPLTAVWSAGALKDASTLQFDFEGDDGFHPTSKSNCTGYITSNQLSMGYILPTTRSLVWDDSLGFPGCYSVKGVAKIIGLDLTASPDNNSPDNDGSDNNEETAPNPVSLVYGASSVAVDLNKLQTQDYKGSAVVPLTSVWSAGALKDASTLQFDFEGDDGFHPLSNLNCKTYVTPDQLSKGYILPETHSLVWDDSLGFADCYSVSNVAKIIGIDQSATIVSLIYDVSSVAIDLTTLPTQDYNGTVGVPLTAVWSAGALKDASTLQFDFEGDDGFHPSSKGGCLNYITPDQLSMGYIVPTTRSIAWDSSLGFSGCYSVKGVAKIIGLNLE
jgi:hypothetical protein